MTSSGGDYNTTENNPWFVGEEPIQYCVENGDLSRNQTSSEAIINDAINDWIKSLKKLQIHPTPFALPDGKKKSLSLHFLKTPCSERTDLRFLLGVVNPEIERELNHLSTYVIAFAAKSKTDDFTGRSKGFIWLSPDLGKNAYKGPAIPSFWREDIIFYNVILHELGHVFGVEHQPSGFMSSQAPSWSVFGADTNRSTTATLTAQNWLQTMQINCGEIWGHDQSAIRSLFKLKSTDGTRVCVQPNDSLDSKIRFTIKIKNRVQEEVVGFFEGQADTNIISQATVAGKYFENVIGTPLEYKWHTFFDLSHYKFIGKLHVRDKKYPIIIEQKMGYFLDYSLVNDDDIVTFKSALGSPLKSDLK